ncbi:uncharacterized protein LOC127865048 [Dreissena polymorpha]|uniref:Interferon-induced transmembrane protein n=1 Tax=Dreissena polymorpha TaxID=45954 RepID=A0A9D4RVF3_DREPO|nr:uncharacterized protein LOC127865048 [Dreissena polymorpha]KAH3880228.1 hypothetical protein DPMN_004138 [Dreissena polymorpha]
MMSDSQYQAEVDDGTANGDKRNSAATIEHEEVHIDLSTKKQPVISTGKSDKPGVKYANSNDGTLTTIVVQKPDPSRKPKDFVMTSCIVIMFCNFVFGIAGWHFGLRANNAWQLGDESECRQHAKKAKIFVICGIITGIITWVLALTLFFTISPLRP